MFRRADAIAAAAGFEFEVWISVPRSTGDESTEMDWKLQGHRGTTKLVA